MKTAPTSDSTWATSTSTTTSTTTTTTTTTTTSTTTSTTTTLRTTPHPYLPPSSSTHQPSLPQILSSPPPPSPLLLSTLQSTVQSSVQSSLHPSLVPFMTTPLPTPTTQPSPLPTFRSHQEISSSSNSLPLLKPDQIIKEKERERAKIPTVMEDQEDEDEDEDEDEEEGSGEGSGEWTEMQGSGARRSYHHHHHHQSWSPPLRTFRNFSNSTRTDLFKNKSQQTLTDTSNATKMKNVELPPSPSPPPVSPLSPPSDKPPCCNPGQWQLFLIVSLVSILLTAVSILLTANKICLKYDVWLNQRRTRNVHRRQRRADYNHQRRLYDRAGEVLEMNILSRATVEPSDTSASQQQEQQEPPAPDTSASQQEQQQPPPQHFKQLVGTFGWSLNHQIRKRSNNNVQVLLLLLQFDFLLSSKKIFSNYSRRWESHKMRHRSSRLERGRRMAAAAAALAGVRQWTIWRKIMISSVWTIVSRMMGVSLPYVQMTTK